MTREMLIERTLEDGAADFGNGVIGPSSADIFVANNAEGTLPSTPSITRNTIFEVGALGATSVMVAACGAETPAKTDAPVVVVTASPDSPIPTAEVTPAPTSTPKPNTGNVFSPEPTEAPTPEVFEIETIVEGDHNAVGFKEAKVTLENALEQNPDANFPYVIEDMNICKTGDKSLINEKMILKSREFACKSLVADLFSYYKRTGDVNFYNAAKNIYNYSISVNGLGEDFKATIDAFLVETGILKNS